MQWNTKRVNPGPDHDKAVKALVKEGFDEYTTTESGISLLRRRADYKPPTKVVAKKKKKDAEDTEPKTEE